jgi:hypothetical protein
MFIAQDIFQRRARGVYLTGCPALDIRKSKDAPGILLRPVCTLKNQRPDLATVSQQQGLLRHCKDKALPELHSLHARAPT